MKRRTLKVKDNVSFVPYFAITKTAKYSRYINLPYCKVLAKCKQLLRGKQAI